MSDDRFADMAWEDADLVNTMLVIGAEFLNLVVITETLGHADPRGTVLSYLDPKSTTCPVTDLVRWIAQRDRDEASEAHGRLLRLIEAHDYDHRVHENFAELLRRSRCSAQRRVGEM